MTWMSSTFAQVRLSQLAFYKRFGFALVGVALPISLCVFMTQQGASKPPVQGLSYNTFVFTGYLGFALFFVVFNLVTSVVGRREALVYKRLRVSPLPPSAVLWGEALSSTLSTLIIVVALFAYGTLVLRIPLPENPALLILAVVLGAVMFSLLGLGLSGLVPSSDVAVWVVTPIMIVFMTCSGIFWPLGALPLALGTVAQFTPVAPLVEMIRTAYVGKDYVGLVPSESSVGIGGGIVAALVPLAITVAWVVIGMLMAKYLFRWDPRRK